MADHRREDICYPAGNDIRWPTRMDPETTQDFVHCRQYCLIRRVHFLPLSRGLADGDKSYWADPTKPRSNVTRGHYVVSQGKVPSHQFKFIHRESADTNQMGFAIFFTQAIPPMLVKISICLFLVRIFPVSETTPQSYDFLLTRAKDNRNLKIAAYTIIGFCCFPQIFIIAAKSIQCKPLSAYWTYGPDSPFCPAYPYKYVLYVAEAFSTATEVAVFILPFPFIWNMTTTRKYRYGLMALFSGGFL